MQRCLQSRKARVVAMTLKHIELLPFEKIKSPNGRLVGIEFSKDREEMITQLCELFENDREEFRKARG